MNKVVSADGRVRFVLLHRCKTMPVAIASGSIVALWFGWIAPAYGYDSALDIQPETVANGFRIFMTVPIIVSSILAIIALTFYPLYGQRLRAVKEILAARHSK